MYNIEETEYGIRITASGIVSAHEVARYLKSVTTAARAQVRGFCIMIDARDLGPLEKGGQKYLLRSHEVFLDCGVSRISSIVASPVARSQSIQLSFQSGLKDRIRHFDCSSNPAWEKQAMEWILSGIEPDRKRADSVAVIGGTFQLPTGVHLSRTPDKGY